MLQEFGDYVSSCALFRVLGFGAVRSAGIVVVLGSVIDMIMMTKTIHRFGSKYLPT